VRIVCLSDTHDRHDGIAVPNGDLLIHAGDLTRNGDDPSIRAGFAWLSQLPHNRIIFVPGNHDFAFERWPGLVETLALEFPRVEVLINRGTTLRMRGIYGSPFQPWFCDWAFNFARGPAGGDEARTCWSRIPGDTEILITHGPVRGILDKTWDGEHVGCPQLLDRIGTLEKLRLHICGHIHEAYGTQQIGNVLYVNASTCDLLYKPVQIPIVVDLTQNGTYRVAP
jgi:predicted phosphodiesterase